MLALSLTLLMAAQLGTPPIRAQLPPAEKAELAAFVPKFTPYGKAEGIWQTGTLLHDGYLNAVLTDATGQTLYGLVGKVEPNGEVNGRLYPMEYATNAALNLPQYAVIGKLELSQASAGTLSLVIYNPLEDVGYVFPHGYIEGVLTDGLRPVVKPGQPNSQSAEAAGMTTPGQGGSGAAETLGFQPRSQIISCPWVPDRNQAADMDHSAASLRGSGPIVCPFEPQTILKNKTSIGATPMVGHLPSASAKTQATSIGKTPWMGHVVGSATKAEMSGATKVGTAGAAGFQSPQAEEGWLFARWNLLP